MDSNKNSVVLSVFRPETSSRRKIEWFFSPSRENVAAIYGLQFGHDYTRKTSFVQVKRFNIFTEDIGDVGGRIYLDEAKTIFQEAQNDTLSSFHFFMCISSDGQTMGFVCLDVLTLPPWLAIFCKIETYSGVYKVYSFSNYADRMLFSGRWSLNDTLLMCSGNGNWLVSVCQPAKSFNIQYYCLVLNDETNNVSMQLVTECIWPDDGSQRLKDELFFDNKLVVFGHENGYIHQMNMFDFSLQTWSETLCGSAPDIHPVESFTPYKIVGTSLDNLYAIQDQGKSILKYDTLSHVWYKTGLTSLHVDPGSHVCLKGRRGVRRKSFFLGLRSSMISPNLVTSVFGKNQDYEYHVVFNVFSPLRLKEICVLKLCKSYSLNYLRENIVPLLPTVLRRNFFFTE